MEVRKWSDVEDRSLLELLQVDSPHNTTILSDFAKKHKRSEKDVEERLQYVIKKENEKRTKKQLELSVEHGNKYMGLAIGHIFTDIRDMREMFEKLLKHLYPEVFPTPTPTELHSNPREPVIDTLQALPNSGSGESISDS